MGRPSTILVNRQDATFLLGQFDETFTDIKIFHERFLAKYMLAGF